MQRRYLFALTILLTTRAPSPSRAADQLNLNLCLSSKTVGVQILADPRQDDGSATCKCQVGPPTVAGSTPDDYVHTPGVGSHKMHTDAQPWNEARKICNDEGGHLAIINSFAEEAALLKIFRSLRSSIRNTSNTDIASLGIHDLYTEGDWVTIFGEPLAATGYAHWSPTYCCNQPDNKHGRQHCGALIHLGGMDDTECFQNFAFFCELPLGCDVK